MQFVKETSKNCELLESIGAITWCITAQQSLASTLCAKQNSNQTVFIPWNEFLTHLWTNQKYDACLILSDFEADLIWQQIIKAASESPTYNFESMVFFAQQAWKYLHDYNLCLDESGIFIKLVNLFQAKLNELNRITFEQIPSLLATHLSRYSWPKKITFVGFIEFTPAQLKLILLLQQHGINVQYEVTSFNSLQAQVLKGYNDSQQQYRTMALWARQIHKKNATKTIGCIIPKLTEKYDKIWRAFADVKAPFHLVCDRKFYNSPLIFHGVQFLKFISNSEFYYQDITQFVLSPFLSGARYELSSRALLDFALRKQGGTHFTLHHLLALAKNSKSNYFSPILAGCVDKILEINKKLPLKAAVKEWVELFETALLVLGWPGEKLTLEETQIVERWKLLLHDFQKIDFLVGAVDLSQALQLITAMVKKASFRSLTEDNPIQVIDLKDAYGHKFDYLWIADVNETICSPLSNPFITVPPDNSRTNNKLLCALTRDVKNSCLISFVDNKKADENILLHVQSNLKLESLTLPDFNSEAEISSKYDLEVVEDNYSPKVQGGELRGAVQTLKLQAICPFKAVTQQRLHAEKIPRPILGLDAIDRGIIVHHLMENIWRALKNNETLKLLSEEELKNTVDMYIDKTLLHFFAKKPQVFKPRFLALEKQRLKKLVLNWLNYEKVRPNFKILSLETEKKIQLGDFIFKIRIDRIDELENNSLAIIDYKTSVILLNDCFGARLTEPQLPIYYLYESDASIQALAFAQIVPKEMKFKGIASEDALLPHVKKNYAVKHVKDWSELKAFWRKNLLQTAEQIAKGYAVADPIDGKNTCQFCDFKSICRKNFYSCSSENENEYE